ncbi:cell division protein FtsQ [Alphaproteobacteria bacterium]|nr:cell division protein FtsQ [Alphaproteobacteria bacterium]
MSNLKKQTKDFFLTNPLLRKIKIFFNQIVKPFFLKVVLLILGLMIILIIALKIFKPEIIEKSILKTKFYFLHYLNLDNYQFHEIRISGNKRVSNDQIIMIVKKTQEKIFIDNEEYQPLIQNLIDEIKVNLPWVNHITISRNMPNILNIFITEYEPFAIWNSDDRKYIIDKDGNPVPLDNQANQEEFKDMIILSGRGANNHAKALFNILAISPALSDKIYSATWVGDRRWNIRFDNGLLVKMPEEEIYDAWQQLIKINSKGQVDEYKVIDLRIAGKIYIEYNDTTVRELKF